ncbi:MAG TPA: HAD family hydrolase [Ignavibacteriales bacterium]|nr:HAD family hydrolase [Ignavibacteriales bacterium]HOL80351.1 HAD family hydrolase [Ignavibacteriales bacterium]HOM64630.1 HAD family hydrolase [Ignavibacteriales bacterium]HPD68182.1 HAD family hydrolase [Ignavibacteriales bacterium]HPP32540.1 HAD family hydrolase [Ignavibacteriales bacterium]
MYKAIIFDVDGTLLNTTDLILESFNYISEKYHNRRFNFKELTKFFGPPEDVIIKELFKENFEQARQDYYHYYATYFEHHTEKYQQILDALKLLNSSDIILAVYTGKGNLSTYITLEKLGIDKYFQKIMTGDNLPEYKPDAKGILDFMNEFNLRKKDVLLVGDTTTDIKAARNAGIDVGIFLWASYEKVKVLQNAPDYCFLEPNSFFFFIKVFFNFNCKI